MEPDIRPDDLLVLNEIEGHLSLNQFQTAYDRLEDVVLASEDRSLGLRPELLALRLKAVLGVAITEGGGWSQVELLAELLAKFDHPHLRGLAFEGFHALARHRGASGDIKGAKDAVKAASAARMDRRLQLLEDPMIQEALFGDPDS